MLRIVFLKIFEPQRHEGTKLHKGSSCIFTSLRLRGLIFLSLFISCRQEEKQAALPYYNTPDFMPQFINSKEERARKITHVIAPFSFQDQDGETVSNKTVEGKIHAANFMFTSCGSICPKMTDNLSMVNKVFEKDKDVVLLSYSVTPWIDTKEKLKAYKEAKGISNKTWHFLTGDKGKIYLLARQSYFAEEDLGFTKDSTEFLHTEHVLLVDGSGRIRGIYNGTLPLEMEQLIKDINALKKEEN